VVDGLQVRRQLLYFAEDRGESQLYRFCQCEAKEVDQCSDNPVQVLRVAAPFNQLCAEHTRLLPQPGDGIDFTVMSQETEWLHPFKYGSCVSGIASMAQSNSRGEIRTAQFWIVVI
jgi:hypothetical protein